MGVSAQFVDYARELLAPLGALDDARFFGGHAFKYHGVQFAMAMHDVLYFCTDAASRAQYQRAGSAPFTFMKKGQLVETKYFAVPPDVLEEPPQLLAWAREAIRAASRN